MKEIRSEVFDKLFQILRKYEYCVLRNYYDLPKINNDIDILVKKGYKEIIIKEWSESLVKFKVFIYNKIEFTCTSVFFCDKQEEIFFHVDLFEELVWRGIFYLDSNSILFNRAEYNGYFIPNKTDEFGDLLLTRLIYEKKIKEAYKNKISKIFNSSEHIINNKYFFLDETLINAIKIKDWTKIESRRKYILKRIIIWNIAKYKSKFILNIFKYFTRTIYRFFKSPGLFICFYGSDGSGKSTQIKRLLLKSQEMFSNKYRIFHFRPKLFYKEPTRSGIINPHKSKRYNFLISFCKLIYYNFMYLWGFVFQIMPILFKNGLIVFDRYYEDLYVDSLRYKLNTSQSIIKFFRAFVPKPDVNFILIGDPILIYERKKEISAENIKIQQQTLLNNFKSRKNCVIIDCNQSIEVQASLIIKEIINFLQYRDS